MRITLKEFSRWPEKLPLIIHSIDMAGYQATVVIDRHEHLLMGHNDKPLRHQSLMHMREALQSMPVATISLRHQSVYDEMINQPQRQQANTLELPLSLDPYPYASER
jgi:hypothetical protein